MTRLIVTTDSSAAGALLRADLADLVIAIERRLIWGPLPSDEELGAFFAPRTTQPCGLHWLDNTPSWRLEGSGVKDRGLIELLSECDSAELWMGPEPNAQLILLWLLDHCGNERAAVSKLVIRQLDIAVGRVDLERLAKLNPPIVELTPDHLEIAARAWRAYRAPTPQDWFGLLKTDLSLLPQLERGAVDLLEELPSVATGLGATEMRILGLIAPGNVQPFDAFPGHQKPNERRVFDYWEVGALLDGLARCPVPAVAGLDEGPFSLDMHDDALRHARYKQSRLSLTDLGKAVLAGDEDFCRHNPIARWWGGTLVTTERLWRWDRESRLLVPPV
ncbi:hypothetical protein [Bradyrhizobium zhanjiangense]|uniref:DUF1835 domain-containing protein n=1 Tax=Bradyrhizobium zhanjiangense TaxID=1325107 RepID=A0A4Q0QMG4_9BRAD|nr:hypothetical protein [Bradyrhizobium zhanjiangense]RXG95917.1 hypothetical protein EAS61_17110 [Bradyrhizobium zhanjiangense]